MEGVEEFLHTGALVLSSYNPKSIFAGFSNGVEFNLPPNKKLEN